LILNRQKVVALDLPAARAFIRHLRRPLRLGKRDFNVCFVDDREMKRLNAAYRGTTRSTDVLSFPWGGEREVDGGFARSREFKNFLGDVVISAPTARRNARVEGHSTRIEICWLILHGALHLLGYDHETDQGEMTSLELSLRQRLGIGGQAGTRRKPRPGRPGRRARRGRRSGC